VLAADEVIPIRIILDRVRWISSYGQLFEVIQREFFDLIALGAAQVPQNDAFHFYLLVPRYRGTSASSCLDLPDLFQGRGNLELEYSEQAMNPRR